ncbi:collagen alpha-2(I) chain-like [Panthera pardus]|uniref:Collagen alpha-2(I) chain-like n=1 Tax=Panthera pardus TaxID=9691 RepID=A0A9W2URQ2_PANPR|nr:collagen alpha-2(I) chain-like [Panthera pardus]
MVDSRCSRNTSRCWGCCRGAHGPPGARGLERAQPGRPGTFFLPLSLSFSPRASPARPPARSSCAEGIAFPRGTRGHQAGPAGCAARARSPRRPLPAPPGAAPAAAGLGESRRRARRRRGREASRAGRPARRPSAGARRGRRGPPSFLPGRRPAGPPRPDPHGRPGLRAAKSQRETQDPRVSAGAEDLIWPPRSGRGEGESARERRRRRRETARGRGDGETRSAGAREIQEEPAGIVGGRALCLRGAVRGREGSRSPRDAAALRPAPSPGLPALVAAGRGHPSRRAAILAGVADLPGAEMAGLVAADGKATGGKLPESAASPGTRRPRRLRALPPAAAAPPCRLRALKGSEGVAWGAVTPAEQAMMAAEAQFLVQGWNALHQHLADPRCKQQRAEAFVPSKSSSRDAGDDRAGRCPAGVPPPPPTTL